MDRDRLKEVHQTDLTESKVNEDFIDWMKTKGPTWLLMILVAVASYLAVIRYRQGKVVKQSQAWQALLQTEMPSSLEDVANEYDGVAQISALARMRAGDALLAAVLRNRPLGTDGAAPTGPNAPTLTAEERTQYLTRAIGYYEQVQAGDDGTLGTTLLTVNAINGLAAIAEAEGEADRARDLYEQAAQRVEPFYPGLATLARKRAEDVASQSAPFTFLSRLEISQQRGTAPARDLIDVDEALGTFFMPPAPDG